MEPISDKLHRATELLLQESYTCVAVNDNDIRVSTEPGVKALMGWLGDESRILAGASVADRIVGKAAAMLMSLGGVREVYADTLSDGGAAWLEKSGIPYSFGKRIAAVQNRQGDGPCPMERLTASLDDPAEAYKAIAAFIRDRMQPTGK